MDRYDYVSLITDYLRGRTGMNFQKLVGIVLREYCSHIGKTYEMPDAYGGDKKNDGWIVEDGLFYQIYAPARNNESLKKNMQKKFTEDLEGLLDNVYNHNLWNGKVNTFIFLVNTFDNNLPEDSERYFEKEVNRLQMVYSIKFTYKVVNLSYLYDILSSIDDISVLKKISALMKIKGLADYNAVSEQAITDVILKISSNINKKHINMLLKKNTSDPYERVSSVNKITINDLEEKRDYIEAIISELDVVESAIKNINQDILFEDKFERVKNLIVERYTEWARDFSGVELYDNLIKDIVSYVGYDVIDEASVEFLIIYIFDKCDIFEKE